MSTDASLPAADFLTESRETFLRWERLRIVFNAVLIALTCITVLSQRPDLAWDAEFLANAFIAAVAANLCFFIGPVAEIYLRWLGLQSRTFTYALFGGGMVFSCAVTLAACVALLDALKN